MAADEVSIFNQALNAIGTRDNVSSVAENSREAEVCRLWYTTTRDQVLRAAYWNCAKAYARLAVAAQRDETVAWQAGDPEPGFLFAYALPSDCIRPRFLSSYSRFTVGVNGGAPALFSNAEEVILFYTKRETNVALWDASLQMAVAYALAAYICKPLTGKIRGAQDAERQANNLILLAREEHANDDDNLLDTLPDWIAARSSAYGMPQTRFFYPYGPMISLGEMAGVS